MPVTQTRSIGTASRNFSTLQSWEDATPVDLTTADQIWKGECYNDSEFTAGLFVDGTTTDATRYQWLTAATGQSFQDHANVRTNALRYNQSNGVGIRVNQLYGFFTDIRDSFFHLARLQFLNESSNGGVLSEGNGAGDFRDLIFQGIRNANPLLSMASACYNIVILQLGTGDGIDTIATMQGCTIVKPSNITASGTGITTPSGSPSIHGCAVFGFTTASSGVFGGSGYNATNLGGSSLPGGAGNGNLYSVSYSSSTPFQDAATVTTDLRPLTSVSLIHAMPGFNALNLLDITGLTRPDPTTIGVWELDTTPVVVGPIGPFPTNRPDIV